MPAPAGSDAGTASQLIPGVRRARGWDKRTAGCPGVVTALGSAADGAGCDAPQGLANDVALGPGCVGDRRAFDPAGGPTEVSQRMGFCICGRPLLNLARLNPSGGVAALHSWVGPMKRRATPSRVA